MEVHILSFATVEEEEKHARVTRVQLLLAVYIYAISRFTVPSQTAAFCHLMGNISSFFKKNKTKKQTGKLTEVSEVSKLYSRAISLESSGLFIIFFCL